MAKVHETVLEIDLKALKHNFHFIKSKLLPDTKILAVVKAFAYGSDSIEVAKCLENLAVDYLAVAYVKEGVALREAGIKLPILVLHPQSVNFKTLIDYCLEPSIYSFFVLDTFLELVTKEKLQDYPIHLKFNTGLNRLGFKSPDVESVMTKINNSDSLKVKSVFSHLAASEDIDEKAFSENQIKAFKEIISNIEPYLDYKPIYHLCNTSGIMNYPHAHFDMVRTGIGLYGFGNSDKIDTQLKPIATLKSIISQIHQLDAGESVGYNRAFRASKPMRSATIPIGHADGIGRQYGNQKGFVTVRDHKAPIIGNVCMDMLMVDITDIPCQEGDEVVLFGKSPSAVSFSQTTQSISYEIITGISQRVKRVYLK
ncbi:alanine racemase [Hanstruepera neustonica]|uniref:Alanine racemase n=1 Tax=Hanstruepera neustonica TaxID=1445657 RepID=A0A2K1E3H9_9FLAO|nr:alanine racemase [Hanstruepera neustonica]PNQ74854.1 alanine racemase [Hanstruepera neustonica]